MMLIIFEFDNQTPSPDLNMDTYVNALFYEEKSLFYILNFLLYLVSFSTQLIK